MFKTPIFKGSCTAIVTPFSENGIDYDKMKELIEFQYDNNTEALVVCGTTGENATMTQYEQEELIDFTCKTNDGRMKIIAGIGSNDTEKALKNAKNAKHYGADGVLMVTPYYNKSTQKGLVEHFSYVADRVDIPMILYNVPSRTGIGINADTYLELSKHPNINGIKEASGDFTLVAKTREKCGDDLFIWSGNDDNTVAMMSLGAIGVISVASNIVPGVVSKICRLCLDGKIKEASELFLRYNSLFTGLFIETNPIPIKTAMNLAGFNVGKLRLPLTAMSEDNLKKLTDILIENDIKIRRS